MTFKRIATEEAFVTAEIYKEWGSALSQTNVEAGFVKMGETILAATPGNKLLHERLLDIGPGRISEMDKTGIAIHVLSLTAPGVQVFDAKRATELAAHANDVLSAAVRTNPSRFVGLGAIAPQDPEAAAREIERIAGALKLHGLIINSHTMGEYLDLPKFAPIFEAAQTARLPIYLHPREPGSGMISAYLDYGLYFATWGFAAETSLHALRLIMSGLFERYPKLTVILGHMGEGLPFWLQRIDNRYQLQVKIGGVKRLPRLPSEYFLRNFVITTSGVTSMPALRLCLEVLGEDRILFAADYPYEDAQEAVRFIDTADITERARTKIYETNARRVFGIT